MARHLTHEQQAKITERRKAFIAAHPEKNLQYRIATSINLLLRNGYRVICPDGTEAVR